MSFQRRNHRHCRVCPREARLVWLALAIFYNQDLRQITDRLTVAEIEKGPPSNKSPAAVPIGRVVMEERAHDALSQGELYNQGGNFTGPGERVRARPQGPISSQSRIERS